MKKEEIKQILDELDWYIKQPNNQDINGEYEPPMELSQEEKKIPEKLDVIAYEKCIHEVTYKEKQLALEIRETQIAFNEIIDYLDYLKSKGE